MSFHIRHASPDDVPALAKLHVQTFNETHRGGRSGGPSCELRERQWREAFTVTSEVGMSDAQVNFMRQQGFGP